MKACLDCGAIFDTDDKLQYHMEFIHKKKKNKKHALPEKFGVILILYGIMQMPVYYFVLNLSYNTSVWFNALQVTSVHPGIVFYAFGLWMVACIIVIGGISLSLTRDKLLPD